MEKILFTFCLILFTIHPKNSNSEITQYLQRAEHFRLEYVNVGFGSNMFEMQPVFIVEGTKFLFTSEIVWGTPGQTEKDTLLTGDFRVSSSDSISNLISEIKDSVIYRSNIRVMSGALTSIVIENDFKKVTFSLHNAYDTTAIRIVDILNTYIPEKMGKLRLCFGSKTYY